jgi:putative tricarboxylic transport membrane protein
MYGGSTTSILVSIPGEVSSVPTVLDGFQMTKQGRAGEALAIAAIGSWIAGTLGTMAIGVLGPALAELAANFGPSEYVGVILFAMISLVGFSDSSIIKGLAMGALGMVLASLGMDPLTGAGRLTFGSSELFGGIDLVAMTVGLFGVGEVLSSSGAGVTELFSGRLGSWLSMIPRGDELRRGLVASLRGTVVGFLLGVLPGMVPAVTSFVAYDLEKRVSKEPQKFGKGAIEGVAAPESANNATALSGFVPLLALGIPTGPSLAIMLGIFIVHGIRPGPSLFQLHAEKVWTLIASMYLGNVVLLILNLPLVGLWARVSVVPYKYLAPFILAVSVVGAYASRNSFFDVWTAIIFGLLSYIMRLREWPLAPLVLGFILGPRFEESLRQSLAISQGSFTIFVTRPITLALLIAAGATTILLLYLRRRSPVLT